MRTIKSLQPIITTASRILILGSMPGTQSIAAQQYYANPRNSFWQIIYAIHSTPMDSDYNARIHFIKAKGIALWDVIETCDREGALDSNIKNARANDFKNLFQNYPNIKLVAFNGSKAFDIYKKQVGFSLANLEYKLLPSTSPANTMTFEKKLKEWQVIEDLCF